MPSRSEVLLAPVERGARIIEIGPSFNPIASKVAGWDVFTLDHATQADLRAKYTGHPGVDITRIEEVDFVWSTGPLSDAVPTNLHQTFDGFIASHVIEHTPDLLSFLNSAETLLRPEGVVVLAVPDKRYCFDYFQPLSTTGQLIDAHAEHRSRHSPRLVFDHFAYAVQSGNNIAWSQHPVDSIKLLYPIERALELSKSSSKDNEYVDCHAWRFTPASFELLLLELARLGETDWRVERTTEADGCEFFAWLRRGGKAAVGELSAEDFASQRLVLLKRTLLETQAQIDWLLASEPNLATGLSGPTATATTIPPAPAATTVTPAQSQYVDWFPCRNNVGRAFEGEWSSAVPGLPHTGVTPLFQDSRLLWLEERLGGFAGKTVLELGPLECGHTYMMTQQGAKVTAIESNVRAWTRCLAVKDTLNMTGVTLLLGDFTLYLAQSPSRVDFALASGVLYHMTDPVGLLQNLCRVSDAIGLWTHYFDMDTVKSRPDASKFVFEPRRVTTAHGRTVELYDQQYRDALKWSGFCGGSAQGSSWLRRRDILGIIEDEGFRVEVNFDEPSHQNGPAFCVFGRRG